MACGFILTGAVGGLGVPLLTSRLAKWHIAHCLLGASHGPASS